MSGRFQSMAGGVVFLAIVTALPVQAQTPPVPIAPAFPVLGLIVDGQGWEVEPPRPFPNAPRPQACSPAKSS